MRKLKVIICDDDANALDLIAGSVSNAFARRDVPVELYTCRDTTTLYSQLQRDSFDLIFLDIQMPGENGISFANRLRQEGNQIKIIYISSREDKVFESFQNQPFGFVRKSSFLSDLSQTIDRFLEQYVQQQEGGVSVAISQKSGVVNVPIDDLCYIEGSGKKQRFHREGQSAPLELYSTMDELTAALQPYGFLRIHKGFLVNYRYISAISTDSVILLDGQELPLPQRKSREVKERYLDLLRSQGTLIL